MSGVPARTKAGTPDEMGHHVEQLVTPEGVSRLR